MPKSKPFKITVVRRSSDWMAHPEGDSSFYELGDTQSEAVGKLLVCRSVCDSIVITPVIEFTGPHDDRDKESLLGEIHNLKLERDLANGNLTACKRFLSWALQKLRYSVSKESPKDLELETTFRSACKACDLGERYLDMKG